MDLRFPIAGMFLLLGGILTMYGLVAPQDIGRVDLGLKVNLIWGLVMFCFGAILASMALHSRRRS